MPVPVGKKPASRTLLREVVFDRLLDAIVQGQLTPGEVLKDSELEQWAGVSRTPVREAIDRLTNLGFVEVLPQKATRVAPIDFPQLADRLETIGALCEGVALDVIPVMSEQQRRAVLEVADTHRRPRGSLSTTPVVISELFRTMLKAWGNVVVLRTLEGLMPHVRRGINARGDNETYYMTNEEITSFSEAVARADSAMAARSIAGYFDRLVSHVRTDLATETE
ncbi:GntR family transcriptional regulator [Microbacterium sp. NPDC089695]|uniref:GntR family transcriptional regulator n=1 Tax=Microbacterium sp. NPDC089695 TaxID=3364198 RepID=UPI00382DBF62